MPHPDPGLAARAEFSSAAAVQLSTPKRVMDAGANHRPVNLQKGIISASFGSRD